MNKKLVVALVTSLIIANTSSAAMAAGGSSDNSTTSTPSTTRDRTKNNPKLTATSRDAADKYKLELAKYQYELAKYLQSRQAIQASFNAAMVNAQREFKVARELAKDQRSIRIATLARLAALQTAQQTKNAALLELGAPIAKPARP